MELTSSMEQQFLKKLIEIIDANLHDEKFGVNELATELGMSRITLYRKVKSIIKKSVSEFIREARLKRAYELLQQKTGTVSEIAYKVGFGSVTYFNYSFHKYYGFAPSEVLKGLHPEVEKTAVKNKPSLIQKLKKSKIFYIIPVVVLLLIVVVLFIKNQNANNKLEKSIAVLPFINDSPDSTYVYFINGVTDAIINNLSSIKDLRVVSRSSTEQYRNINDKSITQIARDLGVNYIIEGSGQKTDNMIKLSIQLIEAKNDKHLFSQSYERNLEDIFSLQSEIALSVANKINAVITPEENKQIESKPTKNIAALNRYLKGEELLQLADLEKNKSLAMQAEVFLKKAVQIDSTYVAPYVGLGWSYIHWHGNLDSGMYFANRALHFDNKNPNALGLKGWILMMKGFYKESEEILQQAIKYNPNNNTGFQIMATLGYETGDYAKSTEYYLNALKLTADKYETGVTLKSLCAYLYFYGFYEEGLLFAEKQIELNNDSLLHYMGLTYLDMKNRNYSSALQNSLKTQNWKSTNFWWHPFYISVITNDFKTAATYIDKFTDADLKNQIRFDLSYNLWYALLKNGEPEKANHYSEEAIKFWLKIAERQNPDSACNACFTLMHIYSAMGNKVKAMENVMRVFACKNFEIEPFRMYELKNHPMFEIIREEPDFQKLIRKNEARIHPEMKKIEKILQDYWSES